MLPTMFWSPRRSMSSSTRIPDSSVATRVSYGAALTTMSLLVFCTLSLPARNELRRDFFRKEPARRKRRAQKGRCGVERTDTSAGPMDDCNEERVPVHQEFANERFQVD